MRQSYVTTAAIMALPNVQPKVDDESADAETASQHSISLDSVGSAQDIFNVVSLDSAVDSENPSSPPYTMHSTETDDISIYSSENGVRESSNTFLVGDWEDDQSSLYDGSERSPIKTPQSALSIGSPTVNRRPELPHGIENVLLPLASTQPRLNSQFASATVDTRPSHPSTRELPPSSTHNGASVYSPPTYPPTMPSQSNSERESMISVASGSSNSRKMRPESTLLQPPDGPIVLGIALVDFNHLVRPLLLFTSIPSDLFSGCRKARRSNFPRVISLKTKRSPKFSLFLPSRTAHTWCVHSNAIILTKPTGIPFQSVEDYSYFHLVSPRPRPTTIFGISYVVVVRP
jgi:hypothetical protein